MIEMTLAEIAEVVGGTAHGDATVTGGAFLDTRTPEPGGLFVAVAGERVDGHDFAEQAQQAGAVAVLGNRPTEVPTVVVHDVVHALGLLARHVVDRLPDVVVLAMTGSQGKTGTKDYLAHVLADSGPTIATRGNFNNELGVPLTALRATTDTRYLVVEMGARGVGHIARLCAIAPPRIAAVLNVGSAHIGEFGSREAIAQAKGELVEALPADGTAVLSADDELVAAMAPRTAAGVVTFGRDEAATVRVTDITSDDLGRLSFDLVHRGSGATVHLRQVGSYQWRNAAAAAAMALAAGLDLDTVADALGDALTASRWRMELTERADGLVVVNDSYNANPESMEAAIETLAGIGARTGRRTLAVLGEMFELGPGAPAAHARVGAYAATAGIDVLVTVGTAAGAMSEAFEAVVDGQHTGGTTVRTAGRDEAGTWLRHNVSVDDVVLMKASRGAALEVLADVLLEKGSDST